MEAKSNNVIKAVPIMEISFTAVHPKDHRLILWITNDARLGLMYCHAFQVKKSKGEEVLETIASSFAEAKKLLQESDGDSEALREMGVLPGGNAQSNGAREREGGLSRSWVLKRSREARR